MSKLSFLVPCVLALGVLASGCNDRARCSNLCQNLADCDLPYIYGSNQESCTDECDAALTELGETVSIECEEQTSDVILCLSLTSCSEFTNPDSTACSTDIEEANAACEDTNDMMGALLAE